MSPLAFSIFDWSHLVAYFLFDLNGIYCQIHSTIAFVWSVEKGSKQTKALLAPEKLVDPPID